MVEHMGVLRLRRLVLVSFRSHSAGANQDYYLHASPFTGATGTGSGLLSARPASCTAGVAYWATERARKHTLPVFVDKRLGGILHALHVSSSADKRRCRARRPSRQRLQTFALSARDVAWGI